MNQKRRSVLLFIAALILNPVLGVRGQERFYRTELPVAKDGNPWRTIDAKPLISSNFKGPIPTNDWWSSLVWPKDSMHSLPMFPHPLAVQAFEDGLGIGYNPFPTIGHSYKDGKKFRSGTSYKYGFRESLRVGIDGMKSKNCLLDDCSDWAVTSLWEVGSESLRATFAHGSPFVFFEKQSKKPFRIQWKAVPVDRHLEPVQPLVFEIKNLTGKHIGKTGEFQLRLDAARNAGIGSKARLVYDFDGDGKTDRVETFDLFATDPNPDSWETYSSKVQKLDPKLTKGTTSDFSGGSVRLEFWKCFGSGSLALKLDECHVELPIRGGRRFLLENQKLGKKQNRPKQIRLDGDVKPKFATVFYQNKNVMGVTINNTHYGIFAPTGAAFTANPEQETSIEVLSTDKGYLSVAVLPDSGKQTMEFFRKHAYAFLIDTKIEYSYQAKKSSVETRFRLKTEPKEGDNQATIFALYRHQHLHLADSSGVIKATYESPRGVMKILSGNGFETLTPFTGVLPTLPNSPDSAEKLGEMVDRFVAEITSRKKPFESDDTYWNGKEFGKISEVIQIADQLGKTSKRDQLVKLLEGRLEDWADAEQKFFFYYDETWNTLVGYPDSYGSADQLNDHHFHYSYFIKAAATIVQFDPEWINKDQHGEFIDLLIRNCANYDRSDSRFPWLRNFDPYAGHSWAAGHASFGSGSNQESSSESMNFATSLILYGEVTKNKTVRDLGIYWYATEAEAIRNYWFDVDNAVFPEGYAQRCVGMVWSDGGTYGTWWTANPEEIHGINFLPITGGSLYLGSNIDYVKQNYKNMLESNRDFHDAGFPGNSNQLDRWQDILHEYIALADPELAAREHERFGKNQKSEFGETKIHTEQWISSLQKLGRFDSKTGCNLPTGVRFVNGNDCTYVVYNFRSKPVSVTFSNGKTFIAKPGLNSVPGKASE